MRDARMAVEAIIGGKATRDFDDTVKDLGKLYDRRGILAGTKEYKEESTHAASAAPISVRTVRGMSEPCQHSDPCTGNGKTPDYSRGLYV